MDVTYPEKYSTTIESTGEPMGLTDCQHSTMLSRLQSLFKRKFF